MGQMAQALYLKEMATFHQGANASIPLRGRRFSLIHVVVASAAAEDSTFLLKRTALQTASKIWLYRLSITYRQRFIQLSCRIWKYRFNINAKLSQIAKFQILAVPLLI